MFGGYSGGGRGSASLRRRRDGESAARLLEILDARSRALARSEGETAKGSATGISLETHRAAADKDYQGHRLDPSFAVR
ncbi:MAG: hypothetical protein AMXMBFR56_35430 [Polyangiaceae bacterium]